MNWYAIHTKFKCEKYIAKQLNAKGIEAYVPLLSTTKRYVRKVKTYEVPLISCYVFVRIDLTDRVKVLETQYVFGFLKCNGRVTAIPEVEMQLMKRVVGELDEVNVEPLSWERGDQVEVISGNLTGLNGKIVMRQAKREFLVELETLGYQLNVSIDKSLLRRRGAMVRA